MKDSTPVTISLESAKSQFLDSMAKKYDLPDAAKALRCLIDYARENEAQHDTIFTEIRCNDC